MHKSTTTRSKQPVTSKKPEVLGILILTVSVLLGLSIISYHPSDFTFISKLSFFDLLASDTTARNVQNLLGPIGARLAHFFMHYLFGYMALFIPALLLFVGWFLFRRKPLESLMTTAFLMVSAMVVFGSILGWVHIFFDVSLSVWSGLAGIAIAEVLLNVLGIGSLILLVMFALIIMVLSIERDIQKTMDSIKAMIFSWKENLARLAEERAERKEINRLEKERQKREADRVKAEKQKEAALKTGGPGTDKPAQPATIDDIVERSQRLDEERIHTQKEEENRPAGPPRAILEKPKETPAEPEDETGKGEDDVDISVYVGKGDEQAGDRELDSLNKQKSKETPVIKYLFPGVDLLDSPPNEGNEVDLEEIKENKRIILDKLKRHKIEIISINAIVGPTVTLYELEPAPDIKISKIESYANDLKMATAAHGLRIIAPIPGRSAVGIEVPNRTRETVYIKQLINTRKFIETSFDLPVAFGKTIENEVFMLDLTKLPHLLMAGATGSGKSVGINTIITCLLYKCHPENLKFVMIDPKKIELSLYRYIKNHFLAQLPNAEEPIVTDTSRALETLLSVTKEMDERYDLLKMAMVRDIKSYNAKFKYGELDEELGHRHLPYIVVIIDELADLMMTAGKQIEEPIARLAQLARAIGIHLVVATQRPSVNVITGTIKANFPARMAYQVASKVDSRTILDVGGADQLIGRGDMLVHAGAGMIRIQNAFVSMEEVERITEFIGKQVGYQEPFYLPIVENENGDEPNELDEIDELFEQAAKVVILHQQGSVSLLQRKLKIGYNRAGRIIDQLFSAGVVGPYQGSTARDVLIATDEELQEIMDDINSR